MITVKLAFPGVHFAKSVVFFNIAVFQSNAFTHSASLYQPPNTYPLLVGGVGSVAL